MKIQDLSTFFQFLINLQNLVEASKTAYAAKLDNEEVLISRKYISRD